MRGKEGLPAKREAILFPVPPPRDLAAPGAWRRTGTNAEEAGGDGGAGEGGGWGIGRGVSGAVAPANAWQRPFSTSG
jgi:hypothetical protein